MKNLLLLFVFGILLGVAALLGDLDLKEGDSYDMR